MSRPILPWRSPLKELPQVDAPVWIRRLAFFDTPVRCTWSDADEFRLIVMTYDPEPREILIGLSPKEVHTWKYQYLADQDAGIPPE